MEIITSKDVLREEELNSPSIIRLVTYLLLNKGTSHPARLICDAIWPDEIIDNPSKKVKALVYRLNLQLKDMLSDRLIVSTKYGYQLNPELNIITDIQQFEKQLIKGLSEQEINFLFNCLAKIRNNLRSF